MPTIYHGNSRWQGESLQFVWEIVEEWAFAFEWTFVTLAFAV
jgi:hypothetical protein